MDDKIREALYVHHYAVSKDYDAIMTVLVGSQNYGLDTEKSDFDTFTFVLPTMRDIATMRDPVSVTREDALGHINIKDIRLALNLLKKTSPNSVECFASRNRIVDAKYADLLSLVFDSPYALRCDTNHIRHIATHLIFEDDRKTRVEYVDKAIENVASIAFDVCGEEAATIGMSYLMYQLQEMDKANGTPMGYTAKK